jgi:ribonuclease PH
MYTHVFSGNVKRAHHRAFDKIRSPQVTYDIFPYALGSVLFQLGETKILCSVTMQAGVPHFLRGKKRGWLTAEYALMPASTPIRTVREVTANKRNGRTVEISRLIGRSLRAVVDLEVLGEQTIFIDCDVLQADGGTRTACISAACLALKVAQMRLLAQQSITRPFLKEDIAGISVGLSNNGPLLDIDFIEDSSINADFNFVLTRSLKIVEVQGSAERMPLSWQEYEQMHLLAQQGVGELFNFYDNNPCVIVSSASVQHKQLYESYDIS